MTLTFFGNYFGSGRLPTATQIKSRAADNTSSSTLGTAMVGQPSVSGISPHGTTILEFWQYIQGQLEVPSLDTTKASGITSNTMQIWETSQISVTEFAGRIAESTNCVWHIQNDVLYVIDRANQPSTFVEFGNYEIIDASFATEFPLRSVECTFNTFIPRPDKFPASLERKNSTVRVNNLAEGKNIKIQAVSDDVTVMETFLTAIRDYEKKPLIKLTVSDIRDDIKIGDRIKFNREEEYASYDFQAMEIQYNFEQAETTFSGKGDVRLIERTGLF